MHAEPSLCKREAAQGCGTKGSTISAACYLPVQAHRLGAFICVLREGHKRALSGAVIDEQGRRGVWVPPVSGLVLFGDC